MAFNLLGFKKTIVAEGLQGKIIMAYGGNNLGKTKQGAKFPKPVFFPFEDGLEAEGDVPTLPIYDWAGFKDYNQSFDKEVAKYFKAKEKMEKKEKSDEDVEEGEDISEDAETKFKKTVIYEFLQNVETIVFDTVTAMGKSCEQYVLDGADANELSDVAHGKLYKSNENEFYREISLFLKNAKRLGLTVLFLAHKDLRKNEENNDSMQYVPKGDWKRVVKPIIDRCSVVVYLDSNGTDENDRVIPSSGYMAETSEYFARIKWDEAETYMEEFSAKNLEKIVSNAVAKQKKSGVTVGSHEDQQKVFETENEDFVAIQKEIGKYFVGIYKFDKKDENGINVQRYQSIVKEYLGVDDEGNIPKIKEAKPKQVKQLKLILNDVKEVFESLNPDNKE